MFRSCAFGEERNLITYNKDFSVDEQWSVLCRRGYGSEAKA